MIRAVLDILVVILFAVMASVVHHARLGEEPAPEPEKCAITYAPDQPGGDVSQMTWRGTSPAGCPGGNVTFLVRPERPR